MGKSGEMLLGLQLFTYFVIFKYGSINMKCGIVSVLSLLFFLAGCAASGSLFTQVEPSSGDGVVVYFYRPYVSITSAGSRPVLLIDGKGSDRLLNGGYVRIVVAPGEHTVELNWIAEFKRKFNFVAGEIYFVRYAIEDGGTSATGSLSGGMTVTSRVYRSLEVVSKDVALIEMKGLRLSK